MTTAFSCAAVAGVSVLVLLLLHRRRRDHPPPVSKASCNDIVTGLRGLGLHEGDDVLVHSSFKALDGASGLTPADVVDALLTVIGASGTLVVPTFTHSGTTVFDPLSSPSKNGAITEAARAHKGAVRSWHPTHAATAIGPAAESLVYDDLERAPLGRGCALDKHAKRGGWVLLLGVSHEVNSTVHVGEDYGGADRAAARPEISRARPKQIEFIHPQHGSMRYLLTSMMGNPSPVIAQHARLDALLRARGQQREGHVGMARCRLVRGADVIAAAIDIMRADGLYVHRW